MARDAELLKKKINQAIKSAAETEVAQTIKEEMSRMVHRKVYDAWDTASYRRMDNGGLSDIHNYRESVTDIGTDEILLEVWNDTPYQTGNAGADMPLTEAVESGAKKYRMPFPRRFIQPTEEAVIKNGSAERALHNGLLRQGLT